MATTFVIACPECGKQVKVSDAHVGKKVKCKECGAVYPVKAPADAGPPPAPGKAKPTQAKAPAAKGTQVKPPPAPTKAEVEAPAAPADVPSAGYRYVDDDEDVNAPKQYALEQTNDGLARCPFCAMEMESNEARICLNCGYNTRTRQRPEIKAVYQPTGGEMFLWLLPGILCVLVIIGLAVWYFVFWAHIEGWMEDSWFEDEKGPPTTYMAGLSPGFCRLYLALLTLALYVPLFRFAIKRLIKNNKPPERKIREE
jgi:hypothetical protein